MGKINGLTENAGHEFAGHEIDRPISRTWKFKTRNCSTWQISCHGIKTVKDRAIVA